MHEVWLHFNNLTDLLKIAAYAADCVESNNWDSDITPLLIRLVYDDFRTLDLIGISKDFSEW